MSATGAWVETDCKFEFQGNSFESGGAVLSHTRCSVYLAATGTDVLSFHGDKLGTFRVITKTRTPNSWVSSHRYYVAISLSNGYDYHARCHGPGFIAHARRYKHQKRTWESRIGTVWAMSELTKKHWQWCDTQTLPLPSHSTPPATLA